MTVKRINQSPARTLLANGRDGKQHYKDLLVWQKGMDLAFQVYLLTAKFPNIETYGLKSQLQRAAVSIPSNIAEGQARGGTNTEFDRFIRIAIGSLAELDTQLELSIRLGYLTNDAAQVAFALALELRKMLFGLLKKLK
ncbi:MAG: four helix bundle protein [Chloroflexi bacterium]|nr:four helix bundle protein [Chloroflexota bacterium]